MMELVLDLSRCFSCLLGLSVGVIFWWFVLKHY